MVFCRGGEWVAGPGRGRGGKAGGLVWARWFERSTVYPSRKGVCMFGVKNTLGVKNALKKTNQSCLAQNGGICPRFLLDSSRAHFAPKEESQGGFL